MPPLSRNHRVPTAWDSPHTTAASSMDTPCAIAFQNRCRCSRRATGGRPGDRIGGLAIAAAAQPRGRPIHTPLLGMLRRPVESAQYTSFAYGRRLHASGLVASMGTVGDALDNAVAESFFATLECELLDRYPWPTRAGLRTAIFDFIEVFYNRQRRHSTLDYASPVSYEQQHAPAAPAA